MNRTLSARQRSGVVLPVLAILFLAGLSLGMFTPAHTAHAKPNMVDDTTVAVTPAQVNVTCQQTTTVDIRINNVTNLFGADIRVSYDPSIVEVVDANPAAPGVQVQSGDRPDVSGGQGLVQINTVDPATGTINYTAIRLNPAPAQSGSGVIATITFRGLATGSSPVTLVSVVLSDDTARPIQSTLSNGQITVDCGGQRHTATPTPAPGRPTYTPAPGRPTYTPEPGKPPLPEGDCWYHVRAGDTLYDIARQHGTTVSAIASVNNLYDLNVIYVGQKLHIPDCNGQDGTGNPTYPPDNSKCTKYAVKPYDTLYGIAIATGDTVSGIASRNNLVNPNWIYAGQWLTVCSSGGYGQPGDGGYNNPGNGGYHGGSGCKFVHQVAPYENLFRIALRYGTNVYALAAANNIANPNLIYVGQPICIP